MKRIFFFLALAIFTCTALNAHEVDLSWTASPDAWVGYNVYRLKGVCPATLPTPTGFSVVNPTSVTVTTFADTTVAPGAYCYYVTATLNGIESPPTNTVNPIVPVSPPTAVVVVTVK